MVTAVLVLHGRTATGSSFPTLDTEPHEAVVPDDLADALDADPVRA